MGFDKSALDRELHQAVLSGLGLHEWYPRYPLMHGAPSRCPPGRVAVSEKPAQGDAGGSRQQPGAGRPSTRAASAGPAGGAPARRQPVGAPADRTPQTPARTEPPARRGAAAEPVGGTAAEIDPDTRALRRCRYGEVLILMHGAIPFAEADDSPLLRDILRAANLHQALRAEPPQMRRVELEEADIGGELGSFVEACLGDDAGQDLRVLMFSPVAAPEGLADHPSVLWAGALSDIARDPDAKRALWRAISAKTAAG